MDAHTAFFYGTLMAPGVLYRVIYGHSRLTTSEKSSSKLTFQSGLLHSYRRHKVKDADYPAITPDHSAKSSVRGTIVTGLTDRDVLRLDIFEGDQYVRRKVDVQVLDGVGLEESFHETRERKRNEMVKAETYIWCVDVGLLEPDEWDFELFKAQKMKRWMGEIDSDSEDHGEGKVEVDDGFADVDRAVAEMEKQEQENDGMGGRNSKEIWKQIEEAAA